MPRGEGMQGENFGVVFAGEVPFFGQARRGTVVKIGPGERGDQARLPGAGSQFRADAQRLAGAGVVEASALPGQRADADSGCDRGEHARSPG